MPFNYYIVVPFIWILIHLFEIPKIDKTLDFEKFVIARGWGRGSEEWLLTGYRVPFRDDEKFCN